MHAIIARLREALDADHLFIGRDIGERYLRDWMVALSEGAPLALARPCTTEEVAAVLGHCNALGVPVVAQGGLTGLAGGATPVSGCVLLSLERMSGVEEIDADAATLTAWAGTPLQVIQDAARDASFFFPLDLGARGSCHIGGNVSTNAGGNRVIRFGMTRDLVLGLEAVLADGTIITSLNKMLKNNAGYDLKQLFIGTEGTLGVITRVVLKLFPAPRSTCAALCAVADYNHVIGLLRHAQAQMAGTISAFEVMWPDFYELVTRKVPGLSPPLPYGHGMYVLLEALGSEQDPDQARFEAMLDAAFQHALIVDAAVAQSHADAQAFWKVRDASGEFPQVLWPHVGFDVSIPTGAIGSFVDNCKKAVEARWPDAQAVFFGHVGDSNIHIVIKVREGEQPEGAIEELVYDLVRKWQGSISAEHGIGLLKRSYLGYSRTPQELALMRVLKHALDPKNILNPGKVLQPCAMR
jgi:FAD/FMN-containing dehydrogenase